MKRIFLRRINSFLCDLALSCLFLYFFSYIKPNSLSFFGSYFLILTAYYLVTWLIFKRTFFQFIFRVEIQTKRWSYILIKSFLVGILPVLPLLFYKMQWITLYKLLQWTVIYLLILLVLNIIIALITRKSIWQFLSRTIVVAEGDATNEKLRRYFILGMLIISIFALWNMMVIFEKAVPVSYFTKKKYVNSINENKQDPAKYIFDLFEKKDIVIISERTHSEYTQWQLFSQIILSDEFASKVGNICTEYGLINNQQYLEDYMTASFNCEEDLKKATARLARENGGYWPMWINKNVYDFILKLHEFNAQKDSTQKINLFFSDKPFNWDTISNKQQWNSWGNSRDSIMAENIMSVYKKLNADRKKILVIENTRHAYKCNTHKLNCTADYIFKIFPSETVNVYVNTPSILFIPSKMGLWDAAAIQVKDSAWAIDFNSSLMGNDYFDMYQDFTLSGKRYKDIFDGMIYYKHPKDFRIVTGYEYLLDDFKDTLLKRSAILGEDYLENIKRTIEYYKEGNIEEHEEPFFKLFKIFYARFHFIMLTFLMLYLVVQGIKSMYRKTVIHR